MLPMMQSLPALGIDVGGGSAKIGIVSPAGKVLAQDTVASDPGVPAAVLIDHYLATAERLQKALAVEEICGIGIGIPGHIDFELGTTRLGNVPVLDDFPIADYVSKKSGGKVFIENDATLAALAEHRFGVGQGSNRFLTVALGTGIGVGFIENGKPVHTANGTMGDIGHVIVDPTGNRSCRQGCHGCLESVASALALLERYNQLHDVNNEEGLGALFESARAGDVECTRIIEETAQYIGSAVVTWMHIFAPDCIAFAGGVSAAGEDLLGPVRKAVSRFAMADYLNKVTILQATLGGKAGLVGAAALCFSPKHPHQNNERVQS
jgi:glucokinase